MVKLAESDIQTREVLDWKGVHLFHFPGSSCSQKVRVFLNLKGIPWDSHIVDLGSFENMGERYLGINPRGLVPTLIIDGEVHIESNDIIALLEERFPEPKLIPAGREGEVEELLRHENDLHLDLRTITFRFIHDHKDGPPKSAEALDSYRNNGTGTVQGEPDDHKVRELDFWDTAARDGITDEAARRSAGRFRDAIDKLDATLANSSYLLGDEISVLDVAWFIYINRLVRAAYPLAALHPNVEKWFQPMRTRPEFASETQVAPKVQASVEAHLSRQKESHTTLCDVAGF